LTPRASERENRVAPHVSRLDSATTNTSAKAPAAAIPTIHPAANFAMSDTPSKRHAAEVVRRLAREYADAECALLFTTPLELLIATILSAQCTDVRVNMVTPALFKRYRSAADFANANLGDLERAIQSTGFFRNKAKNIQACCRKLVDEYNGVVPRQIDALVELPGVGRKTASVVLGTAFGIPSGVVVDTHVARLSYRLGLTKAKDPIRIERDLMALLPQSEWIDFSHRLIHHGRRICIARKPRCDECVMNDICPKAGVAPPAGKTASASRRMKKPAKAVSVKTVSAKTAPAKTSRSRPLG
jgi:endonuclease-3